MYVNCIFCLYCILHWQIKGKVYYIFHEVARVLYGSTIIMQIIIVVIYMHGYEIPNCL